MADKELFRLDWLASEIDRKIFFNALVSPPEPIDKLKRAMKKQAEFKSENTQKFWTIK